MVSVRDVAEAAGVSLGTVSNVLNRPERVSPATRRRVELAMGDVGFVRNESARHLRSGTSKTLAYVLHDASNPFFIDVAKGAEQAAARLDYSLFLCDSDNRLERERTYLARLEEQRVAGVLLTTLADGDSPPGRRRGAGDDVPIVLVENVPRDYDGCSVVVDNVAGGRDAVDHLLDLGHGRIAFVGGPHAPQQVHARWQGAETAAQRAGGGRPATLIRFDADALSVSEGRRAAQRLIGLPSRRRPTAVFCANDMLALGLLQQCVSMGIAVPGELAIVGYDDIEFAAAAAIPLTSIRQPRRLLGLTAAELLLDEATNPDHKHQQVVFTPELVARASTRQLAGSDPARMWPAAR
jgi:LacI family transcriptional regulator